MTKNVLKIPNQDVAYIIAGLECLLTQYQTFNLFGEVREVETLIELIQDSILYWGPLACKHRYPKPNNQGFPTNQCLDCSEWKW